MGIAEAQQQFSAYGSGQIPEFELRGFIRRAVQQDPLLSSSFLAMTDAYRRANLIDAKLQSTITADIAEVTAPMMGLTMVRRRPSAESLNADWLPQVSAANSTDVSITSGMRTGPRGGSGFTGSQIVSAEGASRPAGGTGWAADGAGRVAEGPAPSVERVAPVASFDEGTGKTGATGTGTGTGGSFWDIAEGLTEVAAPLYPGSVLRDRFVLVEELGRGGMGVVYKAYDRSRGDVKERYVAIKVLNEDFKRHPLAVRAMQREARKAQKLAHPNIVGVHDFDRDGGNVFMVMEYLSGRSLDQVLREDGQGGIPLGPAKDIIKGLASALSYAHEQDIVHCDFKPSNAFLCQGGKVKVLDFGIARAAPSLSAEKGDTTLFDAGDLGALSPAYASFELLQREQPDVRDDVYSFSCVAYELLTGRHPYQRLDAVKAYHAGLEPRPVPKLSRRQWRALRRGLAFRRSDRAASIDAVARELGAIRSGTKLWVAAAAAGVLALALGVGVVLKFGRHEQGVARVPDEVQGARADGSDASADAAAGAGGDTSTAPATAPARVEGREGSGAVASAGAGAADVTSAAALAAARTAGKAPGAAGAALASAPAAAMSGSAAPAAGGSTAAKSTAANPAGTTVPTAAGSTAAKAPATVAPLSSSSGSGLTAAVSPASSAGGHTAAGTSATELPAPAEGANKPGAGAAAAQAGEEKRAAVEILREQIERQADGGDIAGAAVTAKMLQHTAPGTAYVTREIPRLLPLSYINLAKSQLTSGHLIESLQTIEDGRHKYAGSTELRDLHVRYVAIANLYDPLRFAVALNASDMKSRLEDLKPAEGAEYDSAAHMLAQTLANRIADQRAAHREAVADKLLEAGKQVFPKYAEVLGQGSAGALPDAPLEVLDQ